MSFIPRAITNLAISAGLADPYPVYMDQMLEAIRGTASSRDQIDGTETEPAKEVIDRKVIEVIGRVLKYAYSNVSLHPAVSYLQRFVDGFSRERFSTQAQTNLSGRVEGVFRGIISHPNRTLNEAFIEAAKVGDIEAVRALHAAGADVNARSGEPLRIAVQNNKFPIVRFLLNHGANIDLDMALDLAALNGSEETVSMLLSHEATSSRALHFAVKGGNYKVVELLLDRADIIRREDYDFAIVAAASKGRMDILRMITSHPRAPVPLRLSLDKIAKATAFAAANGHKEMVGFFLSIVNHKPEFLNQVYEKVLDDLKFHVNIQNYKSIYNIFCVTGIHKIYPAETREILTAAGPAFVKRLQEFVQDSAFNRRTAAFQARHFRSS